MVVLKRIVKLGGAAITNKSSLESLNEEVLDVCVEQLRIVISEDGPGEATCIVHGAGSFGHHTAAAAGVALGSLQREGVREGFVATRASVLRLNRLIVGKLASAGLPACSLSPLGSWVTCDRKVIADGSTAVSALLDAGFLPVLHGDAVLDTALGCTILSVASPHMSALTAVWRRCSGDAIVQVLASKLRPSTVIFLSNVQGVYTLPPEDANAVLVRSITVCEDGSWTADAHRDQLQMTSLDLDTTGGMAAKVEESAAVAVQGIDVFITRAGSEQALACMRFAHAREGLHADREPSQEAFGVPWLGTHVKALKGA